jgi:hypothetical protein
MVISWCGITARPAWLAYKLLPSLNVMKWTPYFPTGPNRAGSHERWESPTERGLIKSKVGLTYGSSCGP